jgi:hypothetical protein
MNAREMINPRVSALSAKGIADGIISAWDFHYTLNVRGLLIAFLERIAILEDAFPPLK